MDGPVQTPAWSQFLTPPNPPPKTLTDPVSDPNTQPAKPAHPGCLGTLTPIEETFRHSHWAARRARVLEAMQRLNLPLHRRFAFANCGSNSYVEVNTTTGIPRVRCTKCHDRLCEPCQRERRTVLGHALAERVAKSKTLHVVLTLKSQPGEPGPAIDRLYASFARLRKDKWWRAHVTGGCYSLEHTFNPTTQEWHPHLHILAHADYLEQRKLSEIWHRVTGDSYIVHVSLVRRDDRAIAEVTKYLAKPIHRSLDFDDRATDAMILALRGRRSFSCFGTWHRDRLVKPLDPSQPDEWRIWGTLTALHHAASCGNDWARRALLYLSSIRPGRVHQPPPPREVHPHPAAAAAQSAP